MRPTYILILLALTGWLLYPQASASVVINEAELDYLEDDIEAQWIELYNTGPVDTDISGWAVILRDDRSKKEFVSDGTVLPPGGFYVMIFSEKWVSSFGTALILENDLNHEMDRTPSLYDNQGDSCAWGRYPDGGYEWLFMESTQGEPNSGITCEEEESRAVLFEMSGSVSGTGYVNLQDRATGPDGGSVKSHEHGSGEYSSEASFRMDLDQVTNISTIGLRKEDLSMRHNSTVHGLPGNRTAQLDSKWTESSILKTGDDST